MSKIGYIIVSTEHQETARQQEIMCDYQVDRIFSEKLSGANKSNIALQAEATSLTSPESSQRRSKELSKKCYKTHCVRTHILDLHHFFAFLHRKAVSFYCRKSQTNYLCIVKTRQHKSRKKIGF